ncbi:hypothetical protein Tco_0128157, partial [Tanacetum coccineum]
MTANRISPDPDRTWVDGILRFTEPVGYGPTMLSASLLLIVKESHYKLRYCLKIDLRVVFRSLQFLVNDLAQLDIVRHLTMQGLLLPFLLLVVMVVMVVIVILIVVVVDDVSFILKLSFAIIDGLDNVVEEEDGEWICFLGGNSSSGIKKYRGSNSSDGGITGDGVKIAGGVMDP